MKNNAIAIYTPISKKIVSFSKYASVVSDIIELKDKKEIINFIQKNDSIFTDINNETVEIKPDNIYLNKDYKLINFLNANKDYYLLDGVKLINISSKSHTNITFKDLNDLVITILKENENYYIYPNEQIIIYHNNIPIEDKAIIQYGDVIDINGTELIFNKNQLEIRDYAKNIINNKLLKLVREEEKFSDEYKRSPRIIYTQPTDDIEIIKPSDKEQLNTETLVKIILPPVLMIGITIAMSIVLQRGPYVLMMVATSILTIILSVFGYFSSRKKNKIKNKERIEEYETYLEKKLAQINKSAIEQEFYLNYHYPTNQEILTLLLNNSSRMYEKSSLNHDFLEIRIGSSKQSFPFKVNFDADDFKDEKDVLVVEAKKIKKHFSKSKYLPRTINLQKGAVGLIGQENILREQVALIVNQIAFFHSYHDVEIYHAFKEEDLEYFSKFNFLPHINSKMIHTRTNIFSQRTRDQVLNSLFQIIKQREQAYSERKESGSSNEFLPKIVFIISDFKQIVDHSIMEYLSKDLDYISVSLIFADRSINNLPEYVKTVVEFRNNIEGRIINENNEFVNHRFLLDHVSEEFDFELIPRILSSYNHTQTLQSSIPEKVGFLEMFGTKDVNDLDIEARWAKNNPGKSLAVPLGYRGVDDIVYLNLHEKAHGPHGLVAGTTGSGKSEIVQSYILSLAINFHPHDVGFLLIDYKGGGMANLFKDLPHLLGVITNLDGAASMRALISIKAELLRRQQLFSDNDVNHIDSYQKLYKEGKVKEPMPHLFMISDEFAELKSEQPEFMKELVSTARIGRSLGIHLILATQKPSGVVDDQIWSNSKFKLCLKVQDEADSNEMLKTKDAASITQPGRAYLQVGNNEIYELFQSAYSGVPYMAGVNEEQVRDNRIYEINQLGQYDLKTQDLSKSNININKNELEAVVEKINKLFKDEKVASPWLEPLKDRIYLSEFAKEEKPKLSCLIGLSDEPSKQAQNPLYIDLNSGNVGIFGLSGFGKTSLLQTIIVNLVKNNTPEDLHLYALDFGGGLLPLKNLPHMADLITIDEEEKLQKWGKLFDGILKERKALFKNVEVADITTYEQLTNNKLTRKVIIIDNYDAMKEAELGDHFDKLMVQLSREGINMGVHIILAASRVGSVRYNLIANFKEKISLFVLDKSEIIDAVGRTDLLVDEIPGRAIIKLEEPTIFQAALPIEGEDNVEINTNLRKLADKLDSEWQGERPNEIPIVPEVLSMENYLSRREVKATISDDNLIALGLDIESVKPVLFNLEKQANLGIGFDNIENQKSILSMILETNNIKTYIIDNEQQDFNSLEKYGRYESDEDAIIEVLREVFTEYRNRIEEISEAKANNENIENILNEKEPILLVFPNATHFIDNVINDAMDEELAELLENGRRCKIYTIWGNNLNKYSQLSSTLGRYIRSLDNTIVFSMLADMPSYLTYNGKTYGEAVLNPYEVNYIVSGVSYRIKYVS